MDEIKLYDILMYNRPKPTDKEDKQAKGRTITRYYKRSIRASN